VVAFIIPVHQPACDYSAAWVSFPVRGRHAPAVPPTRRGPMTEHNGSEALANQRREAGVQVALKTGLLKLCPAHAVLYDPGQHDYQGACMVATYLINRGDPLVAPFGDDRDPLLALLRTICGDYGPSCPQCGSRAGDGPR